MSGSGSRAGLRALVETANALALTFTNSVQSLSLDFVFIHKGHSLADFATLIQKAKRSSKNLGELAGVCGHYATMNPETRRKESLLSGHPGARGQQVIQDSAAALCKGTCHGGARPLPPAGEEMELLRAHWPISCLCRVHEHTQDHGPLSPHH